MAPLTAGRIVHYRLSEQDCESVPKRRTGTPFCGNLFQPGDVVPALVVRPHGEDCFNGQAFLDGNDSLWLTSVSMGDEPGHWFWPERVDA